MIRIFETVDICISMLFVNCVKANNYILLSGEEWNIFHDVIGI